MNSICIVGNLTKNAERRVTGKGLPVYTFSIAVNDYYDGEKIVSYFDVVKFGGDNIGDYLVKGQKVGITGKLRQSRWQAKDGSGRSKVELHAHIIDLLGERKTSPQNAPETPIQPMTGIVTELADDDLPF